MTRVAPTLEDHAVLQAELESARSRLRECEEKLAWRYGHTLASIFDHLHDVVTEFYEPSQYRAVIRKLEEHCAGHPDDLTALLSLGNAYLLRPLGGPAAWHRITSLIADCVEPDESVRAFERALTLAPGNDDIRSMLRMAKRRAIPPLILAALPGSGSVYLSHALTEGLGKFGRGGVMCGWFPHFHVSTEELIWSIKLRATAHTHLSPSRTNLIEIAAHAKLRKMMVHVRDPRQAMISLYHRFSKAEILQHNPLLALHSDIPEGYYDWSTERQIDWQIDHWLPELIAWIKGWADAPREAWFTTTILYTSFERMVSEPEAFFQEILGFYQIDSSLFDAPGRPTTEGDRNFRRGEVDEWRRILTPQQARRASDLIPDEIFDRFGWRR